MAVCQQLQRLLDNVTDTGNYHFAGQLWTRTKSFPCFLRLLSGVACFFCRASDMLVHLPFLQVQLCIPSTYQIIQTCQSSSSFLPRCPGARALPGVPCSLAGPAPCRASSLWCRPNIGHTGPGATAGHTPAHGVNPYMGSSQGPPAHPQHTIDLSLHPHINSTNLNLSWSSSHLAENSHKSSNINGHLKMFCLRCSGLPNFSRRGCKLKEQNIFISSCQT